MDTTTLYLASIGIDIGKEVFHIVGFSSDGRIAFRRKVKRLALVESFKKLPPSVVGMEACLSAHFVSRALVSSTTRPSSGSRSSTRWRRSPCRRRSADCRRIT